MAYTFLDLASDILKKTPDPLTYQEIWEQAQAAGLTSKIKTSGKTPWQTLGARLFMDVRDNPESQFMKASNRPARFFLRMRAGELKPETIQKIEQKQEKEPAPAAAYRERDLHKLLAYFADANQSFNRGRSIYTKTIFHENSQKKGYNEWVHPDMVGFSLPLEDWHPDVIEFNRILDNNSIRLYSFELKRALNKANYRESYFQAVSNSSWAHEGYLVTAELLQDDAFLAELERLASSFGIGIIHLDLHDIDSSSILYPAKPKPVLDWETINKLCEQNGDFRKFIQDVKIDFESKRIHRAEYDEPVKDPLVYIRDKLKIR